jgi:hypothetical protein
MRYLITLEVESEWSLEQLTRGQHGALIFGANHPWRVLEAREGESKCVCTDEPPYKECSEHSGY